MRRQAETQPLLVFDFLNRIIEIFSSYFREVTEDTIKENFTTIYQVPAKARVLVLTDLRASFWTR